MKKLILSLIVLAILSTTSIFSQGLEISNLKFITGKTSLTTELTGTAVFSGENETLVLDINKDLGEAIYTFKIGNFNIGPSGGFFNSLKPVAWIAPYLEYCPTNWLSILSWVGVSLGDPEKGIEEYAPTFCFAYHQITISVGDFKGYYALSGYRLYLPEHVGGINYDLTLNEKFNFLLGVGYKFRDQKMLWKFGIDYSF